MTTPVQPTTSNTHISSNFGKLLAPGLRKIFFETYAEVPEQFSKIYKVNKSNKATETDYGLGAFSDWVERATNLDTVAYDTLSPGLERIYTHRAFTKGFMIERELYDDEQYRQINKFPAAMARAGRAFVEKEAAKTLVNGFLNASPIYDGGALFSDSHSLVDSTGTGNNLLSGALTDTNLKIAMQQMRETVDEAGNLINATPKKLIVPPALEFTAKEIVNSQLKSGTDYNDVNTIKGALEVVVYDYIGEAAGGSDSAWFIMDPSLAELNFFWRVKPEFKWEEDFDTFVAKYRGYMRFSYGVSDWRGIMGSLGGTASAVPAVAVAPVNEATTIAVTTCVKGAKLDAWVNGVKVATATAGGTSHNITVPALSTGDVCYIVQTESGKVPTESAKITVTAGSAA
jgi:phage major head subunit gpT-like protein